MYLCNKLKDQNTIFRFKFREQIPFVETYMLTGVLLCSKYSYIKGKVKIALNNVKQEL